VAAQRGFAIFMDRSPFLNPGPAFSPAVNHPGAGTNRSVPPNVSAVIGADAAPQSSGAKLFSAQDKTAESLAEMAARDLDAALQLLAERAQYISGADGAAIALRRGEYNDMICRASAGSNAPELGALLSMEYGLSGESIRTCQLQRCDDAQNDARVNREACRRLGIASVVVMPILSDNQAFGVFELFSSRPFAFDGRDISALQRLSAMVELAVRFAIAAQPLPAIQNAAVETEASVSSDSAGEAAMAEASTLPATPTSEKDLPEIDLSEKEPSESDLSQKDLARQERPNVLPAEPLAQAAPERPTEPVAEKEIAAVDEDEAAEEIAPSAQTLEPANLDPANLDPANKDLQPNQGSLAYKASLKNQEPLTNQELLTNKAVQTAKAEPSPKKPLFWSAAVSPASASQTSGNAAPAGITSNSPAVPPVLRNLHKCEACGFPVSQGRRFCVECEEKQWRGQGLPQKATKQKASEQNSLEQKTPGQRAKPAASTHRVSDLLPDQQNQNNDDQISARQINDRQNQINDRQNKDRHTNVVSLNSIAIGESSAKTQTITAATLSASDAVARARSTSGETPAAAPTPSIAKLPQPAPPENQSTENPASDIFTSASDASNPTLLLSSALASESWFAANKYILAALLLVAIVIAVIALR
jgi:hypothetical protein